MKSSDIVLQPDFSNYSEISCPEQFQIHRCDVAWAPIIPNVGVVSIEWLRGQQNECFTSIPLGEISGNNEVNIVDMVRVQQNETINLIFKEFLGLKPLLGQFCTITYHFMSLNRLKSVNKILFIHEVLQIKLLDTDGRLIEIEIPLEYRIFPPLTLDNPINSWTIYLIAILIIGLISLIFIYRLRQRYYLGDLKE